VTVAELIEKLSKQDPKAVVTIPAGDSFAGAVSGIEEIQSLVVGPANGFLLDVPENTVLLLAEEEE
jgi:hypothetical protein